VAIKIAVLKERQPHEARVAATPDTIKKLLGLGFEVVVEKGAGAGASLPDPLFEAAGAAIAANAKAALSGAKIVLKVQRPLRGGEGADDELALFEKGTILISTLNPFAERESIEAFAAAGLECYAMELMPRITRAQSMDVLSSQSNLAGYKAVIDAAAEYSRVFPMMMTAAGTVAPARVFVMGAGVAGLQAIATARRLGAIVSATDVRPVAKEHVESLGASFVMVESEETEEAETAGGYAREMSDEYKRRQAELVAAHITKQDIVITTALIPGRPAPVLISDQMVATMKPGSVIVDLAVEQGGNVTASVPGEVVEVGGVKIIGHLNLAARLAADTSALYARNLFNFVELLADGENPGQLQIDYEDEIVSGTLVTRQGTVVHPSLKEE
jgi:NAD(P) transhydrogenase subunit alpha